MTVDRDHHNERVLFVGYLGTGNLGNDVSLAVGVIGPEHSIDSSGGRR